MAGAEDMEGLTEAGTQTRVFTAQTSRSRWLESRKRAATANTIGHKTFDSNSR